MIGEINTEMSKIPYNTGGEVGNLSRIKALLYHHMKQNTNSKLIGTLYLNLGNIYRDIKNFPLAHEACKQAQEFFNEKKDLLNLANVFYQEGILFSEEGKILQAMGKWHQVLKLISTREQDEVLLKSKASYEIGIALQLSGELEDARRYMEDAVLNAERIEHIEQKARTLHGLAQVYFKLGDINKALKLYCQSLTKFKTLKNQHMVARVSNDMGCLYMQKREFNRAISALKYSLMVQKEYKDVNATDTLLKLAEIYLKIDVEEVRCYCKKAVGLLLENFKNRFSKEQEKQLARGFYVMGLIHLEKDEKEYMLMFLNQSLKIYKKLRMKTHWLEVYHIYQKYGNNNVEQKFNGIHELVHGLARYEKLKII
ncbi:MAG: tetratricopeptide repeat protein [Halanaerobiales bacterium]|nr:tetratricopeptide repeat protein [Halanaerobiales bacterium]